MHPNGAGVAGPEQQQSLRLEHFLDTVLKKNLDDVLRQRDDVLTLASSCTQLRQLLQSMRTISGPDDVEVALGAADVKPGMLAPTQLQVNLGHHFYMQAEIKDPSVIRMNIGCGVVVPMGHSEAETFLVAKEKLLAEHAKRMTRETLRIKFRMRLVMEAISRLQLGAGPGGHATNAR